ncbi:MAG: hypothetical protein K2X94_01620 [Amoebophilaceae bacterium]|nr:hypothetical protein [Amoebophilaceae bacterium]
MIQLLYIICLCSLFAGFPSKKTTQQLGNSSSKALVSRLELYKAALNGSQAALQEIVKTHDLGPFNLNNLPNVTTNPEKLLLLAIFEDHKEALEILQNDQMVQEGLSSFKM